jgi:hypothetical protein
MATQKFMGKGQLVDRLAAQVGSRELAISLLKKRGQMTASGKLTAEGKERNNMTAEERAKDRASKATGEPKGNFSYNPVTNRTKKLNRKR